MGGAAIAVERDRPLHAAADRIQRALPLCVVISLAAHVLLLTASAPSERPRQAAHAGAGAPKTLQLRLVEKPPVASDGASAAEAEKAPAVQSTSVPSPPAAQISPPVVSHPPEPVREDATVASRAQAPEASATATAESPMVAAPLLAAEHEDYVPRPLLSIPPAVQAAVIIATPPGEPDVGRRVGILSLFIDEEGRVQHVAGNEPLLPPAFEQAAREAFMAARFTSGQIDGRPVKSRVRVEVVFESTPVLSMRPIAAPQDSK